MGIGQILNTVKVENSPELVRDMRTNAVLNVDQHGLKKYKETRKKLLSQKREVEDTRARLSHLETEMVQLRKIISDLASIKGN